MGRWDVRPDWGQITAAIFYFLAAGALAYLGLSGVQGSYGLWALNDAREQEAILISELSVLEDKRARLDNRVSRLSEHNLDLDLLDERARDVLGLMRSDEIVIE